MYVVRDGIPLQTAVKSKASEQVAAKHHPLQVARRDTLVQVVLGEEKASSAAAGAKTD